MRRLLGLAGMTCAVSLVVQASAYADPALSKEKTKEVVENIIEYIADDNNDETYTLIERVTDLEKEVYKLYRKEHREKEKANGKPEYVLLKNGAKVAYKELVENGKTVTKECLKGYVDGGGGDSVVNCMKKAASEFDLFEASTSGNVKFYQPAFKMRQEEVIKYDTDETWSYNTSLAFLVKGDYKFLHWSKSHSSEGELRQKESIAATERKVPNGFKSLQYGLDFRPLASVLLKGSDGKIDVPLWDVISTTKIDVYKSEYYGSATALEPSAIVRSGSYISNGVLQGNIRPLNVGESLGFKSTYDSRRVSLDVMPLLSKSSKDDKAQLYLSYFDTYYRRPSANWEPGARYFSCATCGAGSRYMIFDTDYRSKGIGVDFQFPFSVEWLGGRNAKERFAIDLGLDYGIENDIKLHDSSVKLFKDDLHYVGYNLKLGYKRSGAIFESEYLNLYGDFTLSGALYGSAWTKQFSNTVNEIVVDRDWQESVDAKLTIRF